MEEFQASKVHLQPAAWLTGKSPADVCRDITGHFGCGHGAKLSLSLVEEGGVLDRKLGVRGTHKLLCS